MNVIPNHKLFIGESFETEIPIKRFIREEKRWLDSGVSNTCPNCNRKCAMMFGDPDGDHWCIMCQIEAEWKPQYELYQRLVDILQLHLTVIKLPRRL